MLITNQVEFENLCEQLRLNPPVAFDTEFVSERVYFAKLCLIQVRVETQAGPIEALIDPLAVDIASFLQIMSDESIAKIVHSGSQDLQILFQSFGCEAHHVFDTQIAAAFLGYGHQVGYAALITRVLNGPTISKGSQYSDWAVRPLSQDQVAYALTDVRYLEPLYVKLRQELVERGRLKWAQTEFRRAEARGCETSSKEELYQRLRAPGMTRRQLGNLQELAIVRDEVARSLNRPVSFVVPDAALVQMARQPPRNIADLRSIRGMPSISTSLAQSLLSAIEKVDSMKVDDLPPRRTGEAIDPQAEAVAGLLGVVVQLRALEHDISRSYLAPRDHLVALADWWLRNDEGGEEELNSLPLMNDWRRELVGEEMLALLEGRIALTLNRAGARRHSSALSIVPVK